MKFKTTASLICVDCGQVKTFPIEADIMAETARDGMEVKSWKDSAFQLNPVQLNGLCSNCKYNKVT